MALPCTAPLRLPDGRATSFIVWAIRDPESAPLQKIQVVKGWVEDGSDRIKIYDIACSDGILPDAKSGLCGDNGATVDLESCEIDPDKGDAELATTWTDPAFDASKRALYYVRVLENPVCRWSTHDAHRIQAELSPHVPAPIE